MKNKHRAFDILGNIAIVNFPRETKQTEKKKFAEKILRQNKTIKTILEKKGKIKGRLRKFSTKYLAGDKTKEVLYKENGCVFRFNVDETYFSPRLSNERKEIASKIKKGENVLVMFAGVAPFSIVIAKNSEAKKVFSNEINRKANKYAELNIELNKLKGKVELVPGDIKKVVKKIGSLRSRFSGSASAFGHDASLKRKSLKGKNSTSSRLQQIVNFSLATSNQSSRQRAISKFDVIVMPRPQLKETFLREAFKLSKKGTRIFYYDFCKEDETKLIVEKIQKQAKQFRRSTKNLQANFGAQKSRNRKDFKGIKILKIKKVGEIAPYKIRIRVDFVIV